MAQIYLTDHLSRFIDARSFEVPGATLREILNNAFLKHPALQSYIVDDQGQLRKHVTVFIDNIPLSDRATLSDAITPSSEIYIMQALSGG